LSQGRTFFDVRASIAGELIGYADYRTWALQKLREESERSLQELAGRFRRELPGVPDEALQLAVRESPQGRRILERRAAPAEADLAGYLAAWLGDVAASDLFARWERQHADRLLAGSATGGGDRGFVESWQELRGMFFVPAYGNVLTLMAPVHDRASDRVGFWRVMLPRLAWLQQRAKGFEHHPEFGDLPLDLVPDEPLGYWLVDRMLASDSELAARLRTAGYRVESIRYELRGKPYKQDPLRAFRETTVTLSIVPAHAPPGRLTLRAHVDRVGNAWALASFDVREDDRALGDRVRAALGAAAVRLSSHR
jgi:hypothetical protein